MVTAATTRLIRADRRRWRFLATAGIRCFFSELRGHLRLSGHSLWRTLKNDIAALLLPRSIMTLWRRIRRGSVPNWRDQPINQKFAERLIAKDALDTRRLHIGATPELDMRRRMVETLTRVMDGSSPGRAAKGAIHGLELTRPFHDKRVVELALAIPQELYV